MALILGVVAFSVSGWAQNTNGRVIGVVTDPQGAAVAGAKVTVTNAGTNVNWNTTTDGKGSYQVLDVPIGMYTVTVESRGFAKDKTEPRIYTISVTCGSPDASSSSNPTTVDLNVTVPHDKRTLKKLADQ